MFIHQVHMFVYQVTGVSASRGSLRELQVMQINFVSGLLSMRYQVFVFVFKIKKF